MTISDAYAYAVVELGIPPSEFWHMTPTGLAAVARRHTAKLEVERKTEDRRAAILPTLFANAFGKTKRNAWDFFPSLRPEPKHEPHISHAEWLSFVEAQNALARRKR